ncbi:MAG: proline iminopeptidase-family hydrolase [Saprospiraceae bacterium]|nr:proline iminopeptidase-family hydrolase [Saprospiraceae bacterium]HMW39412.1 proline iminopeptidase-family hydrolase [Saprospiraceae bacterium]HMX88457.1 proline iminopeptidase-family hydrolase [Saprospiraceae bacterium]HMZ40362.1 proline iminopeptidase-family hydrolase [Saprospiraceae bacterium]HNA64654.1 proline iminopeptidase-family hydrolase [Saprospiraceae bacterium]
MNYKGLLLILAICLTSCDLNHPPINIGGDYFKPKWPGVRNGNVRVIQIEEKGKQYNLWTKTFGNSINKRILLLSGGPGCSHEYFECFENYLPAEGIEFIYYDQLGTGFSDHPKDTSMWDLARYVEEVETVRKALQLGPSDFYLLGHSWGGILAMEYALKYQKNLKGLIISNMMASCPKYDQYAKDVLAKKINAIVLDSIKMLESKGDIHNPRYTELLMTHFYSQFICRIPLAEWPEPLQRSFNGLNESLYVTMQGPSEFGISGKLENWDRSSELNQLKIPVLVIGATYDTMDPEYMSWMSQQIKGATFLLCPNGSHMCMWDDQEHYFQGLISFFRNELSR